MDLNKVIALFLLIIIGYLAKKFKAVDGSIKGHISRLVLNITLPLYIFTAMQFEFSTEVLKEAGLLVVISFSFYFVVTLLSYGYTSLFKMTGKKRDVYQYVLIFSNVGYMGYPIMYEIAGDKGMFYAAIYNLSFNVLTWTLGVFLMSRHKEDRNLPLKARLAHVINPSLVAVVLGFTCFVTGFRLPDLLIDTFKSVGQVTTPLSMMFIGIILAELHIKDILGDWSMYLVTLMRLIIIPLSTYGVLWILGIRGLVLTIPVVLAAMPAAANTAIVAERYDNDYQLASKMIFITTLTVILTIPIILRVIG